MNDALASRSLTISCSTSRSRVSTGSIRYGETSFNSAPQFTSWLTSALPSVAATGRADPRRSRPVAGLAEVTVHTGSRASSRRNSARAPAPQYDQDRTGHADQRQAGSGHGDVGKGLLGDRGAAETGSLESGHHPEH